VANRDDALLPNPSRQVAIAVVDSGWDRRRINPRVLPGVSVLGKHDTAPISSPYPTDVDQNGHGTLVIDIILALAPNAVVVPVKALRVNLETSVDCLCDALSWVWTQDIHIVNLSLSTELRGSGVKLYEHCERLRDKGMRIVAAATNRTQGGFPALFDNVIGVGVDRSARSKGHLIVPDDDPLDIIVPSNGLGYLLSKSQPEIEATSFATAIITGLLARLYHGATATTRDELLESIAREYDDWVSSVMIKSS
jgi:hypothetical protein